MIGNLPLSFRNKMVYSEAPSAMLSRSCFILKAPKKYHELNPPEFFIFYFLFYVKQTEETRDFCFTYVLRLSEMSRLYHPELTEQM